MAATKQVMLGSSVVGTSSLKSHPEAKRLVIVPGHAVYVGRKAEDAIDDKFWIGGFAGEAPYYKQHVLEGVLIAACPSYVSRRGSYILVFSGGQTREPAGTLSEGQGLWFLSDQHNWCNSTDVKKRAYSEDFARDSFENLAFSVARFAQITDRKPEEIIICGWTFKEDRYRAHADALGIRQATLEYVGVNNPEGVALVDAMKGEKKTLVDFQANPLGDAGILAEKRAKRDPFLRGDAYAYYKIPELFSNLSTLRRA